MNPVEVLRQLATVREETLARLAGLTQTQLDARPPRTGEEQPWSLGEVFMHIALDEIYLRELISHPLREGLQPPEGVTYLPPPPPRGVAKEVIEFWLIRARSQTAAYVAGWPADWDPNIRFDGGLEPMNALEWLEGFGGHERYHHSQIESLIAWCASSGTH